MLYLKKELKMMESVYVFFILQKRIKIIRRIHINVAFVFESFVAQALGRSSGHAWISGPNFQMNRKKSFTGRRRWKSVCLRWSFQSNQKYQINNTKLRQLHNSLRVTCSLHTGCTFSWDNTCEIRVTNLYFPIKIGTLEESGRNHFVSFCIFPLLPKSYIFFQLSPNKKKKKNKGLISLWISA